MLIAVVLYPRFTALDMVGPFEVLAFLPGAETVLVADQAGPVTDETGSMVINAGAGFDEVTRPDIVVVPGGPGQTGQMADGRLHAWLRAVDRTSTWTTSVCTGSLLLAAAGLLAGRRATSHWLAIDQLEAFGVTPVHERVVVDGHYVTAAGVSAGIDMALTLAGRIAGDEVAQARQLSIEYAPEPPYDSGSPDSAPAAVLHGLLERRAEILTGNAGAGTAYPAASSPLRHRRSASLPVSLEMRFLGPNSDRARSCNPSVEVPASSWRYSAYTRFVWALAGMSHTATSPAATALPRSSRSTSAGAARIVQPAQGNPGCA